MPALPVFRQNSVPGNSCDSLWFYTLKITSHFVLHSGIFLGASYVLKILMKKLWITALNWIEYAGSPNALKTIDRN